MKFRPWMLASFIPGFAVIFVFLYFIWKDARHASDLADGAPAVALVSTAEPGRCFGVLTESTCLKLVMEVHAPDRQPFTATLTDHVGNAWLPRVQPGSWLTVVVLEGEPPRVAIDERAFSQPPPAAPGSARESPRTRLDASPPDRQ